MAARCRPRSHKEENNFMDVEQELKKFIEGFQSLINIKHILNENNCEENNEESCPKLSTLKKDYEDCVLWSFGENGIESKERMIQRWCKLHSDLPLPRVLLTEKNCNRDFFAITLMMDIYPHYLSQKKK